MYNKLEFGTITVNTGNDLPHHAVAMFLCTLASVNVSFDLKEHDTELHITYKAKVDGDRVIPTLALKVLINMSIMYDLQIQEIIQYYGCTLSDIQEWERQEAGLFVKKYIYRVYTPNLPKVAELLEEWDLLMGQPYKSGELVKGILADNRVERIKLALTV